MQDSWRARSNVTITAGVRYEMFTPMLDKNNLLTNIDPATGAVFYAKDGSIFDRALIHPDRDDIAPRVGVSWSVTPSVVLRGGWGVFYQQTDRYGSESQLAQPAAARRCVDHVEPGPMRPRSLSRRASHR